MNRKQRRELNKRVKNSDLIKRIDASAALLLNEGDKVKINYNRITTYADYKDNMRPEYKEFIEAHKEHIFTVEYDPVKKKNNSRDLHYLVQLKEDNTNPKFLFWSGDLILIKRNKVKEETEFEKHMKKIEENIELLTGKKGDKYI